MSNIDKTAIYRKMLERLLPPGRAWNIRSGGKLDKLLSGLAAELSRVNVRGDDVLKECDPRTTVELLTDWERICGLPDACTGIAPTLAERRAQIVARLLLGGTQTKQFFADLAASLGYAVTVADISEFTPFQVGRSRVGERLTNGTWVYAFSITVPANTTRPFRVGANTAGNRLVEFGDSVLECVINDHKPAHASVVFIYE